MHTLLCLMVKSDHLGRKVKKGETADQARQEAYLDIATKLNDAVHKGDYRNDIDKREVARMIDQVLIERKHVVGQGGVMERQVVPHITRTLKQTWERSTKYDFDGSLAEWNKGRKEREVEKQRLANGGDPKEDGKILVEPTDKAAIGALDTQGALGFLVVDLLLTYLQLQTLTTLDQVTTGITLILLHLAVMLAIRDGVAPNKMRPKATTVGESRHTRP